MDILLILQLCLGLLTVGLGYHWLGLSMLAAAAVTSLGVPWAGIAIILAGYIIETRTRSDN